jgi:hypothetical protein
VSESDGREQPTYIARWAIWDALEGEPRLLAERLRDDIASREERALAADLISGKIKPRPVRKGQPKRIEKQGMVQMVFTMEAGAPPMPRKVIIPAVAEAFHVSEKTVYNALAEYHEIGDTMMILRTNDLRAANDEQFEEYQRWLDLILPRDDSAAPSE